MGLILAQLLLLLDTLGREQVQRGGRLGLLVGRHRGLLIAIRGDKVVSTERAIA